MWGEPESLIPEEKTPEDKIVAAIDAALVKASETISTEGLKVADLVKLLQLRRELARRPAKNFSIRWVGEWDEQNLSTD